MFCDSNDSFLFACVLISSTFWLKHFLHLDNQNKTLLKGVECIRSSRKGIKYFLSFYHNLSNNVYNDQPKEDFYSPEKIYQNPNPKEYNQTDMKNQINPTLIFRDENHKKLTYDEGVECAIVSDSIFDNTDK